MNVALIGPTGHVGSRLLAELLRRGHEVTGIARHPEGLPSQPHLTVKRGDANDEDGVTALLRGHDAVISAGRFVSVNPRALIAAVKKAGVPRLLVVGGAGNLEVAPGVQLVDTPEFPEAYIPEALAGRDFLNALRGERELNWTFLSPSATFAPGERTGTFRLGTDQLLIGADGESRISMEDFAIALVDEIETPRHPRQRFTVGY
jgi:putative NADH-flavin reductase